MIERDATDIQVAVAGQAEFAAHALHSVNLKSAIAPHHDTADGGSGQVKRHAPRIPLFLSKAIRLGPDGENAARHIKRNPVQRVALPFATSRIALASGDDNAEWRLHPACVEKIGRATCWERVCKYE